MDSNFDRPKPKLKLKVGNRELVDGVWICQFCGKEFESGKAMGGHMRVHNKKATPDVVVGNEEVVEDELSCLLCPKTFSSRKQLYGHMRLHPGRPYRGMIPPDNFTASASAETPPCSTIESDHPPQETDESSSPAVDLLRCLDDMNWPLKKSRTGKTSTAIDSELTEDEIGAALALMLLSTGDNRYHADEVRSANKRKLPSDQSPKKRNKVTKLVQINDLAIADQSPIALVPKSYPCNICNKSYATPQALGGHKSSGHKPVLMLECGGLGMLKPHKHDNGEPEAGVTTDNVAATPLISHTCKFCSKQFPSGQALGGHMRRHWPGHTPSSAAQIGSHHSGLTPADVTAKEPVELGFDLNELPEVDDCGEL